MSVFGTLQSLRDRPIGDQARRARPARVFASASPLPATSLFGEEVVEAREAGLKGENFYASDRNPPYWQRGWRAPPTGCGCAGGVAEKLARVNARAGEAGLELFLFDAWRPREVQAYFHDVWMPRALRRRDPSLTGAALTEEVERYWAAPSDSADSPAPTPPPRRRT